MIDELLRYNQEFVARKVYEPYVTTKYPDKKIAIVACMDTRLVQLLPASLGLRNGDVKLIKVAGGVVLQPFDSVVRSLIVAVYELGVEEIMIVGHTDCGAQHMNAPELIRKMTSRGVPADHIDMMAYSGIDFEHWLSGFDATETAVSQSVHLVRHHPLMPSDLIVRGFIMNSHTGLFTEVEAD